MTATADMRHTRRVPRFWGTDSTPFSADGPVPQPCRVVLHQVDDNDFELVEPLVLTPPGGMPDWPASKLVIQPAWLISDLASIPGVLGWFARRHGRHTPAALVHDFLITRKDEGPPVGLPADWVLPPQQADVLFREMLLASGVPPVRSYVMWTAVAARTRWASGGARRLGLAVWGLAAAAGSVALVAGLVQRNWALAGLAAMAPVVAAGLWGRQLWAGLIAGYAVWWAVAGSAPAWLAFKVYQGIEGLVWLVRWLHRRRRGAPREEMPPAPVTYDAR